MYLQHFGLSHAPLGKQVEQLWDDGDYHELRERFQWLLDSPGIGMMKVRRVSVKQPCYVN